MRRLSQAQSVAVREDIKSTFMRIRATLLASSGSFWVQGDQDTTRISREEELYKQEVIRLEKDLSDLEASVENLRGEVINRRTRVNMTAVEDMALVLSRARYVFMCYFILITKSQINKLFVSCTISFLILNQLEYILVKLLLN